MLLNVFFKVNVVQWMNRSENRVENMNKRLKKFYWISGCLSLFINPIAVFWGSMSAGGTQNIFAYISGFFYIWWLPNTLVWGIYLITSFTQIKKMMPNE